MKKFFVIVSILLALVSTSAAFDSGNYSSQTSGEQTSDAAIVASGCYLSAIWAITDGTNNAKVIIYDNASAASGTVVGELTIVGASHFGGRDWLYPIVMRNGIYVDVTGTGASYIIEYIE